MNPVPLALYGFFLAQITENSWVTICAALVTLGTLWINMLRESRNREQDRQDRIALATLTKSTADEIKVAGQERESRIIEKVDAVEKKADAAYEASNGHNEKIKTSVELSNKVLHAIEKRPND